jgi:hypothetical protein
VQLIYRFASASAGEPDLNLVAHLEKVAEHGSEVESVDPENHENWEEP